MVKPRIGVSMLYCLSEPFSKMLKRLAKVDVGLVEVMDEGLHELSKARVAKLNEIAKAKGIRAVHRPVERGRSSRRRRRDSDCADRPAMAARSPFGRHRGLGGDRVYDLARR